jgi:hypothetical protein
MGLLDWLTGKKNSDAAALLEWAQQPVEPIPPIQHEVECGIIAALKLVPAEWHAFDLDKLERTSRMSFVICTWAGWFSLELQVRAWTSNAMVDCVCVVTGDWQTVLPDEIRRCVPAWKLQEVTASVQGQAKVRLTVAGQMAKARVMSSEAERLLVAGEATATNIPGIVQVIRIANAEGQVPGTQNAAATEPVKDADSPADSRPADSAEQPPQSNRRGRPPATTTDREERIYQQWQARRQHHPSVTYEEFAKEVGMDAEDVETIVARVGKRYRRRRRR